ncbi:uncharacterized protein MONBRDRAFT_23365 [Monosiga brevicollis MX1]|uniref:Uncharacterized protein n=1 Tax=Monosiga brevicollis TaxID=81824 RepID=A9UT64_MONBE|nr:uncharacterized protein MONBRDRAFT_23365 [Monosiga brevicollis MX1]EDQ91193.1 predicted protein [Monosiga brevicollis MX1]|eukprot:XP_001743615.1 hypothetical protein [Monosiga brevicollis MX1]
MLDADEALICLHEPTTERHGAMHFRSCTIDTVEYKCGEFVRCANLAGYPECIGEIKALYELDKAKLCDLTIYVEPEHLKDGREPSHGRDEVFARPSEVTINCYELPQRQPEQPKPMVVSYRQYCRIQAERKFDVGRVQIPLTEQDPESRDKYRVFFVRDCIHF